MTGLKNIFAFTLLYILFFPNMSVGQTTDQTKTEMDTLDNFEERLNYFTLSDTIELNVIQHYLASPACGILATASLTIGTTMSGDTIVVIELCNSSKDFKTGQIVKVTPRKKPTFHVLLPRVLNQNDPDKLLKDSYDLSKLKTTYGNIENK